MILIGALLLWGFNYLGDMPISPLDALFTSTSAVCVTGLAVVDTGRDLVFSSQAILLLLIQLGGLGVMTAATFTLFLLRRPIGIRQRLLFAGGMGLEGPSGAVRLVARIVKMTLVIECLAAVPLFFVFSETMSAMDSLWCSIFHSVSAFCNAGFSLFSDSLEGYATGWLLPAVVMFLIVLGGIGFIVLWELGEWFRGRKRLSIHTRLVLVVTVSLVFFGAAVLALTEWDGLLRGLSVPMKIWNALFASVTSRTAGFNTLPTVGLSSLGAFLIMILMMIGASPGSTGGGMKTTTFGLLVSSAFFNTRGNSNLVLWHRSVPQKLVLRAMMLAFLYVATVLFGILLLNLVEDMSFRSLAFEVVSAMGTVGLSMGVTADLSPAGKWILILLMFWGRVGILTFLFSLANIEESSKVSYAETSIPIG
ncbi:MULTISPECIES: TrkH family potassium uptake protein [Dethiosulfovibrio]|uniref:TrkH family potassium uptake protein n=2 Tax=Dethiosulfovibrio TaxID=47054 RepID=A0ABS9EQ63_9BACT|nr:MULTISPECIES: TrkH family potassium uptake protein [Dethiosulfovibrio]MCF4115014.1 TrkH family potassium uptake protein [Dethiosulfovibrio russensis]MCF4143337.1 TrkH family potassium uptake protein [Dethiosulfovibrio marinus]MCF4145544.1 TrkH family potassium uptake protein [Dethiosulfovibrio acidaminovorans]